MLRDFAASNVVPVNSKCVGNCTVQSDAEGQRNHDSKFLQSERCYQLLRMRCSLLLLSRV